MESVYAYVAVACGVMFGLLGLRRYLKGARFDISSVRLDGKARSYHIYIYVYMHICVYICVYVCACVRVCMLGATETACVLCCHSLIFNVFSLICVRLRLSREQILALE
jgi:hypothetical protein